MTQTVQSYDTTAIASPIEGIETLDLEVRRARLKCKLNHPGYAGDSRQPERAELLIQILDIENEICWTGKPATPSDLLPIRRQ